MPAENIGFEFLYSFGGSGIQSEIDVGTIDGKRVIRKKSGYGLPFDTLMTQVKAIEEYRQRIKDAGISIPKNYLVEVCASHRGLYLEQADELIDGINVQTILASNAHSIERKENAWKDMLDVILGSHDSSGSTRTKAMLDAKSDNFVVEVDTGKMFYVDTYPPMLHSTEGLIEPFIEEVFKRSIYLMSFNFGDIRGMLLKLIALLPIDFENQEEWLRQLTLETIEGRVPKDAELLIRYQAANGLPLNRLAYSPDESDRERADKIFLELLVMQ